MKKFLAVTLVLFIAATASAQLINFAKTLPVRAYSLTLAPIYNVSEGNVYHPELRGMSYVAMLGYGLKYDLDFGFKYGYYNGKDLFAAEMQYMFRETRKSYYSFYGGIHKWKEYGLDAAVTFTHTPNYNIALSAGLDLDVDISEFELRAWIPLNIGINFDDRYYIFFEYDLPGNERSWDILGGGMTFIFR
ncbi:MAG TPA: hypothetical protein VJ951_14990 [Bacteroidales bacterium]|nr:hypothetical protein [Bacteroidales bacterium]